MIQFRRSRLAAVLCMGLLVGSNGVALAYVSGDDKTEMSIKEESSDSRHMVSAILDKATILSDMSKDPVICMFGVVVIAVLVFGPRVFFDCQCKN